MAGAKRAVPEILIAIAAPEATGANRASPRHNQFKPRSRRLFNAVGTARTRAVGALPLHQQSRTQLRRPRAAIPVGVIAVRMTMAPARAVIGGHAGLAVGPLPTQHRLLAGAGRIAELMIVGLKPAVMAD